MSLRVGITGSSGFIGRNIAKALKDKGYAINHFNRPGQDLLNSDPSSLREFIKNSDIIIHAAAINRGTDSEVISGGVVATNNLARAIVDSKSAAKIVFISSVQADLDNVYGRSKNLAESLLADLSKRQGNQVSIFRVPNVFGENGRPFYNSVVHTFCHQIANNQRPKILVDKKTQFIYIQDLSKIISKEVDTARKNKLFLKTIRPANEVMVSGLLRLINSFKNIKDPSKLKSKFHRDLYRTYLSFQSYNKKLEIKSDERGKLVETFKIPDTGQVFYSTTKPNVTRGDHYHTRKKEVFCVIEGKAKIRLRNRKTGQIEEHVVDGEQPEAIEMKIGWTHNIKNIGKKEMKLLVWVNEIFNPEDPDTFSEEV